MFDFNAHVLGQFDSHGPLLQPRLGFSSQAKMEAGLIATAASSANTIGTITLDAFTRVNDLAAAQEAIDDDTPLNVYPIVNHPADDTREMIKRVQTKHQMPVQIRHGSPNPVHIFQRMAELGLSATEGGPVSYCLPYSRLPLREAFEFWREACQHLAKGSEYSHIESFAGCMMGQMCDPAVLIAINILEGLFLRQNGIATLSFSYAQGTSPVQDRAAVNALQQLAANYFTDASYHFVAYVFMGFFPRTLGGFCRITNDALSVVQATGIQRVILKTPVESRRIPLIDENVAALEYADYALNNKGILNTPDFDSEECERITRVASQLVETTLALDTDISEAILNAFSSGLLSIPYCLHPDNRRNSGTVVTAENYYHLFKGEKVENAFSFLSALGHNIRTYDQIIQPA